MFFQVEIKVPRPQTTENNEMNPEFDKWKDFVTVYSARSYISLKKAYRPSSYPCQTNQIYCNSKKCARMFQ